MIEFGPTFIWVGFNIIVLYLILRKLLFKRVTEFMENRTKTISDLLEHANKDRMESEELRRIYEERLKTAQEEAEKIINEAISRANREYDEIVKAARRDAEELMMKAREELEHERKQMLREVRNQVVSLAVAAASKVIQANMDNERNKALVDKFIEEAGAA